LKVRLGPSMVTIFDGAHAWHHAEITERHLMVDGRQSAMPAAGASTISLTAMRGGAEVSSMLITSADDRGTLLLHRLAELHARLPLGGFPLGADLHDRLHVDSTYWTSGFWPGALWQAAALIPGAAHGMFSGWALSATVAHFGQEQVDTHDVGFEYGESSLAAWQALCAGGRGPAGLCGRLKRSVVLAADELLALATSNGQAGTIPTNSTGAQADTIIDSMMNAAILPWAARLTGNPEYARVAARHAHAVARLLVRADGSTAQAVNFSRATGRVVSIATHQGLSRSSTWSRGQAWAVYGFSQVAQELHDRSLLRVALRTAAYVRRHLPPGGIPRWDYDARAGAPVDLSAGVITAAGLFHLVDACQSLPGVCAQPGQWAALGRGMLAAALTRVYSRPPLGFLPDQVLNERGHGCWCNGGELIFGATYALEALNRARRGT
jgi:unsaturated chondroitin disaccharide hydrolase